MSALVDVEALARLRRRAVVIAARDGGAKPVGGIPGSFAVDVSVEFSEASHPLPCTVTADPAAAFERLGIGEKTPVVVYGDRDNIAAARVWWLGHVSGMNHIAVLDGGLSAWKESGRELGDFRDVSTVEAGRLHYQPEWERLADAADVRQIVHSHNSFLVDVRSPSRYAGLDTHPSALRPGHIPGASNLPIAEFFAGSGRMREPGELRDLLEEHIGPAGAVTFYSERGMSACVAALAANVAGYGDVRVYEGSWAEWGLPINDLVEFPIETSAP